MRAIVIIRSLTTTTARESIHSALRPTGSPFNTPRGLKLLRPPPDEENRGQRRWPHAPMVEMARILGHSAVAAPPPNRAEPDQRPVLTLWVPHRARSREAHGIADQWEAGTTPAGQTWSLLAWLLHVRRTRICLARCRSMTWGDSRAGDDEWRVSSLRVRRIRASRRTPGVPRCERTSPLHPLRFPEPTMGS